MAKTLLVDGNNLLKIGFHGVKDYFNKGEHIGGLWHFLNTLRRFIDEENFSKVVVFWDGETSSSQRRLIYPKYKLHRKAPENELKEESFNKQKHRVKEYLEEMFVRQVEFPNSEADDLIAYYCQISKGEDKTIFSGDRDLTQLITDDVTIYSPNTKKYYKKGDMIKLKEIEVPHYNIKTFKILSGDKSDNIDGIYYFGEKTFVKLFPELLEKEVSFFDILTRGEELLKEQKDNTVLKNLLTGKTKEGIFGNEFFIINKKIVDLSEPLISEEGKELVELYYSESLDPDGRGYKNLIRMMMDDGLFKYLPKNDDAWVYFLKPFLKLTRKEKTKFKTKK
jgi:5'-3' exonuclease